MFNQSRRWLIVVLAVGSFLIGTAAAQANERYYMMIFAAEGNPNLPRLAHTFATFVKVEEKPKVDPADWPIEVQTISWLPATLDVRLLVPPERGVNLDLKATLKFEKSQSAVVSAWGPFEIRKELYDDAVAQVKRLNSGSVAYKALDGRIRPTAGTNCFHAVSDIVGGPLLDTGKAFGEPASRMVLQHLARFIIEPRAVHRDLARRLALDKYSIEYRDDTPTVVQSTER